jgi:hypothetical protein
MVKEAESFFATKEVFTQDSLVVAYEWKVQQVRKYKGPFHFTVES